MAGQPNCPMNGSSRRRSRTIGQADTTTRGGEIMGRRYFQWASLTFGFVQPGTVACTRDGGDRRDEPQGGIVSRRADDRSQKRAIGGGPRSAYDGGAIPL